MVGDAWPPLPELVRSFRDAPRRVGVELEFGGISPEATATIVAETLGGTVREVSEYEYEVRSTELGNFGVEVDLRLLKRMGRELAEHGEEGRELMRFSADVLGAVASAVVPVEVVTPPVPWTRLTELDAIVAPLREAGALGTSHSAVFAFGVQFNPDVPSAQPAMIVRYLQAFLCLHDWLRREGAVDPVRRLSPFINRFPGVYEDLVLADDYAPDQAELIADYLDHNPTRNRALDLLPLLTWLEPATVREALPNEKINPRPTFHYRLPNCEIHLADWSLAEPWRHWLQVEYLAADDARLADIRRARRHDRNRLTSGIDDDWIHHSEAWLRDL